ncbi:hypothetical protein D9M71_755710 [compost metagenome]
MGFDQYASITGVDHKNRAAVERIESHLDLGFLPPALVQLAQFMAVVRHGLVTDTLSAQRQFIHVVAQASIPKLFRIRWWYQDVALFQQLHGPCRRAAWFKAVLQTLRRRLHIHVCDPLDDQGLQLLDGIQALLHRTTNGVTLQ